MQRQRRLSFRWLGGDRAAPRIDRLRYLRLVVVFIVTRGDLFVWLVLDERYQRHILVKRGAMVPHNKVFNLSDSVFLEVRRLLDVEATTTHLILSTIDSGILANVGRGGNASIVWRHSIQETRRIVFGCVRSQSWLVLDMLLVEVALVVLLRISRRLLYLNPWLREVVVFEKRVWSTGWCDYGWIL